MNSITPLWIIDMLSSFKDDRVTTTLLLANKEQELKENKLYKEIEELKQRLRQLDKSEEKTKEQWKEILFEAWIKEFTGLDWTKIMLAKTPWKLVIESEDDIPESYYKIKETKTLNKLSLKEDLKEWCLIAWCYIEQGYNLKITHT